MSFKSNNLLRVSERHRDPLLGRCISTTVAKSPHSHWISVERLTSVAGFLGRNGITGERETDGGGSRLPNVSRAERMETIEAVTAQNDTRKSSRQALQEGFESSAGERHLCTSSKLVEGCAGGGVGRRAAGGAGPLSGRGFQTVTQRPCLCDVTNPRGLTQRQHLSGRAPPPRTHRPSAEPSVADRRAVECRR
ncbi:hypothetical protein EVAR_46514_1 [Eumeta japonica]|uniref:Uncharacterized protein n=1 Tax=Eumeta variegata TaxID=151549 RepID=A0A4C1WRZ2_EUMVA|nr:hypothetical protein EVAR_46514_1 [Eumeta japonica]